MDMENDGILHSFFLFYEVFVRWGFALTAHLR